MKRNATRNTYGPRGILSFRPAEPISQMIKLETARRQSSRRSNATATRVIADAVAQMLGPRYPALEDEWKKLKNLSKAEGVDAGQIPATGPRPTVEHAVFDAPGGEQPSMPKSPALPVAAQPGTNLKGGADV